MRKYQVSIKMTIADKAPAREFSVYADANNIWEAVCAGFFELSHVIQSVCGVRLPGFGCVEHQLEEGFCEQVKQKTKI